MSTQKKNQAQREASWATPLRETPEPGTRQGRRNFRAGVQLMNDDGTLSDRCTACLQHIFGKYCTPRPTQTSQGLLVPSKDAYLSSEGLDKWAIDTNGMPFDEEAKQEIADFMDVTDDGDLTLFGYMQLYYLQTENDEEETWRDLFTHGFDRTLNIVSSRREERGYDITAPYPSLPSKRANMAAWVPDASGDLILCEN